MNNLNGSIISEVLTGWFNIESLKGKDIFNCISEY